MMQHLTRTQLEWTRQALAKVCVELMDIADDPNESNADRAFAELHNGNLTRVYDILCAALEDPKSQRIAID